WRVEASEMVLDKNRGRGVAWHARLMVKEVPVFYLPYFSFPLDHRRKTGFLSPSMGMSEKWGAYLLVPFYWNIAPNYDATLTSGFLSKRGFKLNNDFRYLTAESAGELGFSILTYDQTFANFKKKQKETYKKSNDPIVTAELQRLLDSSNTRKSFF